VATIPFSGDVLPLALLSQQQKKKGVRWQPIVPPGQEGLGSPLHSGLIHKIQPIILGYSVVTNMKRRTGIFQILIIVSLVIVSIQTVAQQQIADPDFHPVVTKPAYRDNSPTVAIDEAHDNSHTLEGLYSPLAALLRADGYKVIASKVPFEKENFAGIRVLVVANARNLNAILGGDISKPAFTEHECDVLADWIHSGGSLLLIADHAPFGNAAETLARRFGVNMGKGWVFDRAVTGGITTQLEFSRQNGLLGKHPILSGRSNSEKVNSIHAFTGQSLTVPPGATILMKLSPTARDAAFPPDMDAEDLALRGPQPSSPAYGSRSTSAAGRAQGLALSFGTGRIVVLGEAAMLSAQILRFTDPTPHDTKIGMNTPGSDDRQFGLNIFHWLSGLLELRGR
jgi:hypothetical protein